MIGGEQLIIKAIASPSLFRFAIQSRTFSVIRGGEPLTMPAATLPPVEPLVLPLTFLSSWTIVGLMALEIGGNYLVLFCIPLFLGYNSILLRPNLNLWKAFDGFLMKT